MQSRAYLLQGHVRNTFTAGGWFTSFRHALESIGAKEAAWSPDPKMNSIWQIVNHVTFYTQITTERLTGAPRRQSFPTNDETFGPKGDPSDQAGWEVARAALFRAGEAYQEAVGRLTDEQLDQPVDAGGELPVSFRIGDVNMHNAHHLGQIVTLLQIQGAWRPIDWS